eukprot:ctg_1527.g444
MGKVLTDATSRVGDIRRRPYRCRPQWHTEPASSGWQSSVPQFAGHGRARTARVRHTWSDRVGEDRTSLRSIRPRATAVGDVELGRLPQRVALAAQVPLCHRSGRCVSAGDQAADHRRARAVSAAALPAQDVVLQHGAQGLLGHRRPLQAQTGAGTQGHTGVPGARHRGPLHRVRVCRLYPRHRVRAQFGRAHPEPPALPHRQLGRGVARVSVHAASPWHLHHSVRRCERGPR